MKNFSKIPGIPIVAFRGVRYNVCFEGEQFVMAKKKGKPLTAEDVAEDSDTIKRYKAERLRRVDYGDLQFYACLVFQSKEQKEEFLASIEGVPVLYGMYIDGQTFCDQYGFEVTPNECPPLKRPFNKKLAEMVDADKLSSKE